MTVPDDNDNYDNDDGADNNDANDDDDDDDARNTSLPLSVVEAATSAALPLAS